MKGSPEPYAPLTALDGFDFAAYEQEVAGINPEEQAQVALAGILTIQAEDGSARSFEQINQESEIFFNNPVIKQMDRALDMLAMQYVAFCMAHGEGGPVMGTGALGDIFQRGTKLVGNGHSHDDHSPSRTKTTKNTSVKPSWGRKEAPKASTQGFLAFFRGAGSTALKPLFSGLAELFK